MGFVLSSLLFKPFFWREKQFFTRQVKVQIGKSTNIITTSKLEYRLWREINNFFIDLSSIHLSTEKDQPNPSEMDIKVLIPAPQFFYALNKVWFIKGKYQSFPKARKENKFYKLDNSSIKVISLAGITFLKKTQIFITLAHIVLVNLVVRQSYSSGIRRN